MTLFDSVTGKPLFQIPMGRTLEEWIDAATDHGFPLFNDEEVIWDNVRCLDNGECVSVDGTHIGKNLPSDTENRYCISLVTISGYEA